MRTLLASLVSVLLTAIAAIDAAAQDKPPMTQVECIQQRQSCEAQMYGIYGSMNAPFYVIAMCEPAFQQCLAYAYAAANPPAYTPAPAPAPERVDVPIEAQVRVVKDVDVYDAPGGTGNIIGMLKRHQEIVVFDPCVDSWCHVEGDLVEGELVPGRSGYVYSGPEFESLHFN